METPTRTGYLTHDDVRNFMLDRSIEDNLIDRDLAFSDEEIADAMRRCARDYNAIPPYGVSGARGDRLPGNSTLFLYGVAKQLYLSALQKLMRNDIDYTAGNVTTSLTAKRIEHYTNLVKLMDTEFKTIALAVKKNINIRKFMGKIG